MRDDFLFRCHAHEALRPSSPISRRSAARRSGLRRALVQPATRCGYRFEDDELVDEMLAEVEGERGALPLLAFAARPPVGAARPGQRSPDPAGLPATSAASAALSPSTPRPPSTVSAPTASRRPRALPQPRDRRGHPRRPRVGRAALGVRARRGEMRRRRFFAS